MKNILFWFYNNVYKFKVESDTIFTFYNGFTIHVYPAEDYEDEIRIHLLNDECGRLWRYNSEDAVIRELKNIFKTLKEKGLN